jgi:bacterioferritin
MKHEKSIALLNTAIADELFAVHQYMYFHFHLADQGFDRLSLLFKRTAITEMTHVETLAERILFLKGDVEMAAAGKVEKIADPAAILEKAVAMEAGAVKDYNQAAIQCAAAADSATKQLFERLIADEESHMAAFELQLENIKRFGPNYLALQSIGNLPEAAAE